MTRIRKVLHHWLKVDGTSLSAAVTFYAALALFPVILVLLSVLGWLLSSSESVQKWRTSVLDLIADRTSPEFSETVASQLDNLQQNTSWIGSIGGLTLLAFSIAFFRNLEKAFGRIWEHPREPIGIAAGMRRIIFGRLKAYLMILLLIIVVAANLIANVYLEKLGGFVTQWIHNDNFWWAAQTLEEVAFNAILFAVIYQIMTRDKVKWQHAIYGGLVAAVLWQPGRYLIATYLISDRYTAFGIVGAFWGVLLWIYYGVNTILLGATFVFISGREKFDSDSQK